MRARIFSMMALGLLATSALAQQAYEGIEQKALKADVYFLSAPEMAGRKTTSRESRIAANYIAAEFMRLGLKPLGDDGSYFQNFDLTLAAQDDAHTALTVRQGNVEKSYQLGHDFDLTWITQTTNPTTVSGSLVFLGHGIRAPEYGYDELSGIDLHGKIVIILPHEPQERDAASKFKGKWHTYHAYDQLKYEEIRKAGAVGILEVIEKTPHRPPAASSAPRQDWFPDAIYSLPEYWDLPVFEITEDLANQLLASSGKTVDALHGEIDGDLKPHSFELKGVSATMTKAYSNRRVVTARNVLGVLEGSDPKLKNEYVIVSAHHDHLGVVGDRTQFGADDNASGEAALLEVARAFASAKIKPKRSILFVSFDSEEAGMLGSFYYARHPALPITQTAAILNMDMIGRDENSPTWKLDPRFTAQSVNLVGTLYSPDLRRIAEQANAPLHLNLDFKTDTEDKEEWLARSDQYVFATLGVPVILFNTGEHPDYHTENDTWDKLNYPKLEKIARLVYLTADGVANSAERPRFNVH
jgi:Zn-dependent M28 family amino/carboxypeptidase